jgi:Calcineurin-like phosphoesterase
MRRCIFSAIALLMLAALPAVSQQAGTWKFAVSGDSRNCGDVVMPAIARDVLRHNVAFYWHLGDFRKMYDLDEDIQHEPEHRSQKMTLDQYRAAAWDDFIRRQIAPFGGLPVFLGIGNHELYKYGFDKEEESHADFLTTFHRWLASPDLQAQRRRDNDASVQAYYHWKKNGVDFINLDNSRDSGFEPAQLDWLTKRLEEDKADAKIHAVVVGMHRSLPNGISCDHSMNEGTGTDSGRRAYAELLSVQNDAHKHVYILGSHSHFFMERIYETPYWKTRKSVLPGWIVGTAGAVRYLLPENWNDPGKPEDLLPPDILAKTFTYGYLLATVHPSGEIDFEYREMTEDNVPAQVLDGFGKQFVDFCFLSNRDLRHRELPATCKDE